MRASHQSPRPRLPGCGRSRRGEQSHREAGLQERGPRVRALAAALAVTGLLLSPDIVSNKIVHFDLLHEDVSLQYFIPAFS